jgi:hypothetical protein
MKLMTKEIEKKIPELGKGDGRVYAKFFTPWAQWTWYASEYDPKDKMFYGFVKGDFPELGYWRLGDLTEIKGPFLLKIERDLYWDDTKTLDEVQKGE